MLGEVDLSMLKICFVDPYRHHETSQQLQLLDLLVSVVNVHHQSASVEFLFRIQHQC